jgi:DNA-binding NarL/FixJ family response regulator
MPLLVAVLVTDEKRRAALTKLFEAAGYRVVAPEESDVIVSDTKPRRGLEELSDWPAQGVLTPRELDVIEAIGAGFSNKAIARELGISLHTVKFHIESLLRKLGARTRAEAVAKALERRKKETVEL